MHALMLCDAFCASFLRKCCGLRKNIDMIEVPVFLETTDIFEKNLFSTVFDEKTISSLEDMGRNVIYGEDFVTICRKTQMVPVENNPVTLYADDIPVELSEHGTVTIPSNTMVVSRILPNETNQMNSDEYDTQISQTLYECNLSEQNTENKEVVFSGSCGEMIARMDEKEEKCELSSVSREAHKTYGDTYLPGDWVHCNRFNGPNSDCVHYNWRSGDPVQAAKAFKNFAGSDCDAALTTGSGCTSIGSCQCNTVEVAAYCSEFTKDREDGWLCSHRFHRHTDGAIPRDK